MYTLPFGSNVSCSELENGFQQWKTKAIGDIGPLISHQNHILTFNNSRDSEDTFEE